MTLKSFKVYEHKRKCVVKRHVHCTPISFLPFLLWTEYKEKLIIFYINNNINFQIQRRDAYIKKLKICHPLLPTIRINTQCFMNVDTYLYSKYKVVLSVYLFTHNRQLKSYIHAYTTQKHRNLLMVWLTLSNLSAGSASVPKLAINRSCRRRSGSLKSL